jgi:competence protein ComFC
LPLFWTETWNALGAALFPTACVSCGALVRADDPPLCAACWARLPTFDGPECACGRPLPGAPGEACGRCRRGLSAISLGAFLGPYEGALRECVLALKYRGRHRTARGLAARALERSTLRRVLEGADVLVPVPLHQKRLKARGFNQSALLAENVSGKAGVAVLGALVRIRDTPSQTELSVRQRRLNVRAAFALRPGATVEGAVAVLIDDVVTTGATLRECATTLRQAGAREVRAIAVARAE